MQLKHLLILHAVIAALFGLAFVFSRRKPLPIMM